MRTVPTQYFSEMYQQSESVHYIGEFGWHGIGTMSSLELPHLVEAAFIVGCDATGTKWKQFTSELDSEDDAIDDSLTPNPLDLTYCCDILFKKLSQCAGKDEETLSLGMYTAVHRDNRCSSFRIPNWSQDISMYIITAASRTGRATGRHGGLLQYSLSCIRTY